MVAFATVVPPSLPSRSADTSVEAEALQIEIFRRMTPAEKAHLVSEADQVARSLALAGLRRRHPEAGPAELHRRLMDLLLGEELALKVYGPVCGDPE